MTDPVPDYYMTVKEVAAILRKHPITIYRWLEGGKIFPNVKKCGQNWLISRHDLVSTLNSGRSIAK